MNRAELHLTCHRVLPLTREWIEIDKADIPSEYIVVLPLTREWIEMTGGEILVECAKFSLLRGSGLKFCVQTLDLLIRKSSPSYEGVD